jgi:hypothetical protein
MISAIKDIIRQDLIETYGNFFGRKQLIEEKTIQNFEVLSKKHNEIVENFYDTKSLEDAYKKNSIGYDWGTWTGKIRKEFLHFLPINFLSNPLIAFTMVHQRIRGSKNTISKIKLLSTIFDEETLNKLLKEDFIGKPVISNQQYLTSSNRTHHAMHLGFYKRTTGEPFWNSKSIIEFGGGYGNMARLIKKMNSDITYTIIDLPELLAIQYIYLGSLFSEDCLNIVNSENPKILEGKINLVTSDFVINGNVNLSAESFISNWALTECPEFLQKFVLESNLFNAKKILLASFIDQNNYMSKNIDLISYKVENIPFLDGNHQYWIK